MQLLTGRVGHSTRNIDRYRVFFFEISRRCLKVEDGAATEPEGRKEECHATDPSLAITRVSSRRENNEKRRRNGGGTRIDAEKPGKGGQLEPSHYNDWFSLQKQTPHLLRSLLPQLPAVITRLCVCEHALVRVNTRGHQHSQTICARRQADVLTSRSGKVVAVKRNAIPVCISG